MHLVPSIGRASFGLGRVALNLAREQRKLGVDAKIWSIDPPAEVEWAAESAGLDRDCITGFSGTGPESMVWSVAMERAVGDLGKNADLLHQHGIWSMTSRVTNKWRTKADGPTVVAPHGALGRWAMKRSVWKKRLAGWAYEGRNLRDASCVHAGSEGELEEFREFGVRAPVAIVPNGVSDDWLASTGDAAAFRAKFGISDDARILLFLSRITPKKGLPMFLEAMAGHRSRLGDWLFIIAGSEECGHQAEVEALIQSLDLGKHARILGPLFDADKRNAFEASELCVLPSHSEGAPIVVLEALGAGVPVLTTKASPWSDLTTHSCGWWTDISAEAIGEALDEVFGCSSADLAEKGENGRALIGRSYTWKSVAQTYMLIYDWLLNGSPMPDSVVAAG